MVLEETICVLEATVSGIRVQLREGSERLESARTMVAIKLAVASFFENLTAGKTAEAFSGVADNVKWWAPGGILLHIDKERMMRRMQSAPAAEFVIKEAALGDSCVAVRVALGAKSFQFLFLFEGQKIVGVKESVDNAPLLELLKKK